MDLDKNYFYFFKNKGICPLCKEDMVPSAGCVNIRCKLCIVHMKEDEEFKYRVKKYTRIVKRVAVRNEFRKECFSIAPKPWENIDTTVKKTYNNDV